MSSLYNYFTQVAVSPLINASRQGYSNYSFNLTVQLYSISLPTYKWLLGMLSVMLVNNKGFIYSLNNSTLHRVDCRDVFKTCPSILFTTTKPWGLLGLVKCRRKFIIGIPSRLYCTQYWFAIIRDVLLWKVHRFTNRLYLRWQQQL